MPTFDLVVLGCGGGPDEHNLSSYLLKPAHLPWSAGTIALEAGSGLGALTRILQSQPGLFGTRPASAEGGRAYSAAEILAWVKCYLITHAHMDHTNSLVLCAGSIPGGPRRLYAVHQTLLDLQTVFSDRLWPNLASWDADKLDVAYTYTSLPLDGSYAPIQAGISVRTMPISHGRENSRSNKTFDSSAFFIRENASSQEFLFFGDVEPDSVSLRPRLRDVWRVAAPKIPRRLSAIFIECSYPLGRKDHMLYGHLCPEHLCAELVVLAEEVVKAQRHAGGGDEAEESSTSGAVMRSPGTQRIRKKQRRNPPTTAEEADHLRGALHGVRVFIIHCKSDMQHEYDRPMHEIIADQVRALVNERGLGAEIIPAYQGMHISL